MSVDAPLVIIPGGRLSPEINAVKRANGGLNFLVRRTNGILRDAKLAAHSSETEMNGLPVELYHEIINNNSTLDRFIGRAISVGDDYFRPVVF